MCQWSSGGLQAEIVLSEGVLRVTFSGLVSPTVTADFIREPRPRSSALCLLVDVRQAFFVILPEQLAAEFEGAPRMMRLPGAVLCRPEDSPALLVYAQLMADIGIVRTVFTDAERAEAWARERAQSSRLALLGRLAAARSLRAA